MRKHKAYFGKRRGLTPLAINKDTGKSGVPRLLRAYFHRQCSRYLRIGSCKLAANSSHGTCATPSVASRFYSELLEERRELKRQYLSGNW